MIAVVQRVLEARVNVAGETVGTIGPGLLVLASIVHDDTPADAEKLALDSPTPAGDIENFVRTAASASPEVVRRLTDILNPHK